VYSELGHGTTVRVCLPRASDAARDGAPPHPLEPAPRGSETVLFMSGYSAHPDLDEHAPLLSKPFTPRGLSRAVRDVLDGREGA